MLKRWVAESGFSPALAHLWDASSLAHYVTAPFCSPCFCSGALLSVAFLGCAVRSLRAGSTTVASVVTCCLWGPVLAWGCSGDKVTAERILALPRASSPLLVSSVLPPAPALMLPCPCWRWPGPHCPGVGDSADEQLLFDSCTGYLRSFASEPRLQARDPWQKTTRGLFHPWHLGHWPGTKVCPSAFLFPLESSFSRSSLSWCKIPTSLRNQTVNTWAQERTHLVSMWNPCLI